MDWKRGEVASEANRLCLKPSACPYMWLVFDLAIACYTGSWWLLLVILVIARRSRLAG